MLNLFKKIAKSTYFKKYSNTILLVLILFFSFSSYVNARTQEMPPGRIFVQTVEGQTIEALSSGDLHRETPVVKRFAKDFVMKSFQWEAGLPAAEEAIDGNPYKFPAALHAYSWKIDEPLRTQWLLTQTQKYNDTKYDFGRFSKGKVNAIPRSAMEPIIEELEPGVWKADIRASRHFFDEKGKGLNSEKLHYQLIIVAKSPDISMKWGRSDTLMGQAINSAQLDGLKITNISDYSKGIV